MLNTKALMKAMQFMCLPTLSFLVILYMWFFDWTAFSTFVTSKSAWASTLRVAILLIEFSLVYYFYQHYSKLYENEAVSKRLHEGILGDNFEYVKKSNKIDAGNKPRMYHNESTSQMIDNLIQPQLQAYHLGAFRVKGIDDCIVLKILKAE